jgi:uncharacterized protein (DUF1778 family)
MATTSRKNARTSRLNIRATRRQEQLIRTAAKTRGISVTNFILHSACLQAEHAIADQRDFVLPAEKWRAFASALDRPARVKPELARLFKQTSARRRTGR